MGFVNRALWIWFWKARLLIAISMDELNAWRKEKKAATWLEFWGRLAAWTPRAMAGKRMLILMKTGKLRKIHLGMEVWGSSKKKRSESRVVNILVASESLALTF